MRTLISRCDESLERAASGTLTSVNQEGLRFLIFNGGRPYQREIITAALEGHDVFVQAGMHYQNFYNTLPAVLIF